jgi:hypothetical protein
VCAAPKIDGLDLNVAPVRRGDSKIDGPEAQALGVARDAALNVPTRRAAAPVYAAPAIDGLDQSVALVWRDDSEIDGPEDDLGLPGAVHALGVAQTWALGLTHAHLVAGGGLRGA